MLNPSGYDCRMYVVHVGITVHVFSADYLFSIKIKIVRQQCSLGKLISFSLMTIIGMSASK